MKAVTYEQPGGPEVMQLVDVADPVIRPHDALVAVEAISIEGGDLISRNSPSLQPGEYLGYSAAGTILETGSDVNGLVPGKRWQLLTGVALMQNAGQFHPTTVFPFPKVLTRA